MEFSGFYYIFWGFIIQIIGLTGNYVFLPITTKVGSRRPRISIKLNEFFNNSSLREKSALIFSFMLIFGTVVQAAGFVTSFNEQIHDTGKLLMEIDELKIENTRLWDEIYDLKNKIKFGLIGPEYDG